MSQPQNPKDKTVTQQQQSVNNGSSRTIIIIVCSVILYLLGSVVAGYLSWSCNDGEGTFRRVTNVIFASLFSFVYVLRYLVNVYIMDWRCPSVMIPKV